MKKYIRLGCIILFVGVIVGCGSRNGSTKYNESSDTITEEIEVAETMASQMKSETGYKEGFANNAIEGGEEENVGNNPIEIGRKLIKTVSMDVETEEFDSLISKLLNRISGFGGYIESSNTNNSSYYRSNGRHANYVVRIPSERLDELVGNVTELANVTWKEENVQDITLHYIDIESHKIALQTEQERLLVLMEQAETVEDLITIESRLSEIRYQIQSYESTLRTYDNQVNYSTLHLAISEVKKLTPQEEPSVWKKIQDGFIENLDQVIKGVRDFFVEVMIAIPYLLLWGIVLFFGCWIGKKLIKKTKGKEVFWHFRKVRTTKNSKIDENNDNTEKQSRDEKK